jgi:hypothetical protein
MPSTQLHRLFIVFALLTLPALACSIGGGATSADVTQSSGPTDMPTSGDPPKVAIEAPPDHAQAVVNQSFTVQVHATDAYGVTRIVMSESGRLVAIQPLPSPDTDAKALLSFRPTNIGPVTLQVVAYRGNNVPSAPVNITIDVVVDQAHLTNPNALDATSGVAAGAICAIKTTVGKLNLRSGPGTNYNSLAQLNLAEDLNVIGRNTDSTWFQVKRTSNNAIGWVSASYTAPNDGCDRAPVVTAVPAQ